MIEKALLLTKENNCGGLFRNPSLNVEVMVRTTPDGCTHLRMHTLTHINRTEVVLLCLAHSKRTRRLGT